MAEDKYDFENLLVITFSFNHNLISTLKHVAINPYLLFLVGGFQFESQ